MWRLVRDSGALDLNSPYAYLLLCMHQDRTCLVAEEGGPLVGFVTAYVPPRHPGTVFVWQVAVAPSHRRRGLGVRLIEGLLDRCPDARFLECTVTPSNRASLGLFRAVAARRGAGISVRPFAHLNDFLEPGQVVAAGARMVFLSGVGAAAGPVTVAVAVSMTDTAAYFLVLAGVLGATGTYALWRLTRRGPPPPEERVEFRSVLPPSITRLISDLAELGVADEADEGTP